jgi:transketolase
VGKGAYVVWAEEKGKKIDYTFFATGSELYLALEVAQVLVKRGKNVRVTSVPSQEIFAKQSAEYRRHITGGELGVRVSVEAAVSLGWHRFIGSDGIAISVDSFGASAPQEDLAKEYGFTVEKILERLS